MTIRKAVAAATAVAAFGLTALVVGATPAAANHIRCGDHITQSVTFTHDVTNCREGLHVMGSNITIDLNGYTLSGRSHPGEAQYGIHLMGVSNVTVTSSVGGAVVSGFDAGVFIQGGADNEVSNLIVRDNINDLLGKESCDVGDGILVEASTGNLITGNTVRHNGPYSGIALIFDADGNEVSGNEVVDNNVPNVRQGSGKTGPCGSPFSRRIQDVGIRVEGPGADDNLVAGNDVRNSAIGGITIHGYVCNPPPEAGMPPDEPNTGNTIFDNTVSRTGEATFAQDQLADGIAIWAQGPAAIVCTSFGNSILNNVSFDNMGNGIAVNRSTRDNEISFNTVYDNGRHGIVLSAGIVSGGVEYTGAINNTLLNNTGFGNGTNPFFTTPKYDGADFNPACDNNAWHGNAFGTFNQACVVAP